MDSTDLISRPRSALASALLNLPLVADCAILVRSVSGRECSVAYVVARGPLSRTKIEAYLQEVAPTERRPDRYVFINRLPVGPSGRVDEAALSQMPIVDETLAREVEARLSESEGVLHAAVFLDEQPTPLPPLHERWILPREALAADGAPPSAAAPHTQRTSVVEAIPAGASAVSAESEGAPLSFESDAPRTLPDALRRAANRVTESRITYLGHGHDRGFGEQTFAGLLSEARRIHGGLRAAGVGKGQEILFQLERPEDILPAFWGCLLGGFVPVVTAIPPSYVADTNELDRLCRIIRLLDGPPILRATAGLADIGPLLQRVELGPERVLSLDRLRATPPVADDLDVDPDRTAFLSLTSGSTGTPKAIMLSHANILSRARGTNALCGHTESDRIFNWLPFDHIGSISDWHLRCVLLGCHMVYCTKEYVLGDPLNWLRLIDRFRITHSWAPNFAYALVNESLKKTGETWDLSCLQSLLTAGEAVSSSTVREFLDRLLSHGLARTALRPAFGMAELGSGVTYYVPTAEDPVRVRYVDRAFLDGALRGVEPGDPQAAGFTSLGRVIPSAKMRIVDAQDRVLAEDTVGRLQIAGGPVCLGYYRNPDANRDVFTENGWFNTGDRGFLAGGELYLTGRDKETLVINGANYHNGEIEASVESVPGVRVSFTAACAVRDTSNVERLAVFFCPDEEGPASLTSLLGEVQNSVSRKTGIKPDYLLPVDASTIPKTAIGKIQRKELVKRFERGEFEERVQRVDLLQENERTIPDWFLRPAFRPKSLSFGAGAGDEARRFLLIEDGHGFAKRVAAELLRRGMNVVVTAADGADLAMPSTSYTDIVDLSDYAPPGHAEHAEEDVSGADAMHRALHRASELVRRGRPRPAAGTDLRDSNARLRYRVVASHSQAAELEDTVDAPRAMVPALLAAFAQESGTLECRHLDVPFSVAEDVCSELARVVADECLAHAEDEEVAYRHERRLVQGFERITWPTPGESPVPLERGALYLVTGGLGGVGAELSRYLLEQWGAALIIVGRTAVEENEPPTDRGRRVTLANLERLGSVRYEVADVNEPGGLGAAVLRAEAQVGRKVSGAFHLASGYHELPLIRETADSLEAVFGPKVRGAAAVHSLLAERAGFVVCFSSVASVNSGAGIGAYAAANRLLDALCHEQRRLGRASHCINWSVWRGLGIGRESAPVEVLRSKGYQPIPVAKGLSSLVAALRLPPGQVMIGVDPTHPSLAWRVAAAAAPIGGLFGVVVRRPDVPREPLAFPAVTDAFGNPVPLAIRVVNETPLTPDGQVDRGAMLATLRGGPSGRRVPPTTLLQKRLARIWQDVLGLDSVGINESFFDLGGTSLLSVRLFVEMEQAFGVGLPLATLFQASTIDALCALLQSEHSVEAEKSVRLLSGTTEVPDASLHLIHDADGTTAIYQPLADLLSPTVRVYGIGPRTEGSFPALHTRIQDMAAYCVGKIQRTQPRGPYLVGGLGLGGVLAHEVACRLQSMGEEVALVLLLDSIDASASVQRPVRGASRSGVFPKVDASVTERLRAMTAALSAELTRSGIDYARVRLLRHYADRGERPPWFLEHIPLETVYRFAKGGYTPGRFSGRLTLFRASASESLEPADTPARELCRDPYLGWASRATRGVEAIDVPGGHRGMLLSPHVTSLAHEIRLAIGQLGLTGVSAVG